MTDRHGMPAAVLWDMDGTLVDTEPYWMATEHEIAAEAGGTWTHEDAMGLVGNPLLTSGRYIKDKLGLAESPEQVVERLLDGVVARVEQEVPWCPGARELLLGLHEAGVPCGLVTMSYQRFVAPILRHLPKETFSVVVTGDAVDNGKPHPEPYLTAAAALGVPPEDCLAIEDSGTGASSAEAAGCTVLVVPNHVTVPPGPRRVFRDSLTGVRPDALPSLG
ncbi:HAD family phosphatase [Nocardioides panacisoli]|uniref:HAD family hydrolase n=1 Tax=Nocardioides panacisoli TaxID=627624 RepID=UPI001C62EE63|nr:HAD family phosphatase [Nocardioides panacisoli]QYJ05041.1 HAD family phosphatase [Nocardioides panacisoli]